jgi:hypothetical protein
MNIPPNRLTTIRAYCAKHQYTGTPIQSWLSQRLATAAFREKYHVNRVKDGRYWMYDSHTLDRMLELYDKKKFTLKTQTEYVIQNKYENNPWEDVCTYDKKSEALVDIVEYRNSRTGAYRLITRRVANPDYNPSFS